MLGEESVSSVIQAAKKGGYSDPREGVRKLSQVQASRNDMHESALLMAIIFFLSHRWKSGMSEKMIYVFFIECRKIRQ